MPSGSPASATAARSSRATSSPVPGCDGWPLTITGQPAASADAVSPPAVENASGKFEAPNTATGPIGTSMRRTSGSGIGDGVRVRVVDDRLRVVAGVDDRRERLELPAGALELGAQARLGQPGLGLADGARSRRRPRAGARRRRAAGRRACRGRAARRTGARAAAAATAARTSSGVASSKLGPGSPVRGSTELNVSAMACTLPVRSERTNPAIDQSTSRADPAPPALRAGRRPARRRHPRRPPRARRAAAVRARPRAPARGRPRVGARGDRRAAGRRA